MRIATIARLLTAALCALATVLLTGFSGVGAGLAVTPGDDTEPGAVLAGAVLTALVAFLPAIACVASARPVPFTFRLLALSVASWLLMGAGMVVDDSGRFSWPLSAVMGCITLIVLVRAVRSHASTSHAATCPGSGSAGDMPLS